MPTGAQGQKCPADAVGCAMLVGRIATRAIQVTLNHLSGNFLSGLARAKARAASLTAEDGTAVAMNAAARGWA